MYEKYRFSASGSKYGGHYILMVIDDTSWKSQYNFEKFIDNTETKDNRLSRTKNLFYVSCSRAKDKLVVLALSEMGEIAIDRVREWFGEDNVFDYVNEDENE